MTEIDKIDLDSNQNSKEVNSSLSISNKSFKDDKNFGTDSLNYETTNFEHNKTSYKSKSCIKVNHNFKLTNIPNIF